MKNLIDILSQYNSIAIAGMAKNAGKTTTLNYMISGFAVQGAVLGLTSIGLDGEETDQVTSTPKPRIFAPAGTVVATAEKLLVKRERGINDIAKQILAVIDIATPLGRVVVARALTDGNVMLAGPSMVSQIAPIMQILQDHGATKIIIDGAAGRKSLAVPHVAQAIVLATGAGLSKSMDTVIAETRHIAEIFNLPTPQMTSQTVVGAALCRPSPEYTHIPGAVTDTKIDGLYDKQILAEDATKILITPKTLARIRLSGGSISVQNRINLAAITINPTSPYGTNFDAALFLEKMSEMINVPIFNVERG